MPRRAQRPRERGQVLIITALLLPVLLGMTALAIDLGSYASERRALQNAADSIALAAGRDLPNAGNAQTTATQWAGKNGVDVSTMTVTVSGGNTAPRVKVSISKPHEFTFIRVLGIGSKSVAASAIAGKFSDGAGAGVVPWAVTQSSLDVAVPGSTVTLKYDSNNVQNGNFGIIDIDGNGSSVYEDEVKYGASGVACASGTTNCSTTACPGTFPNTCAENAPSCDGPDCNPETGNKIGSTRTGVDFRMQYTSATCDTFLEAFSPVTAAADIPAAEDGGELVALRSPESIDAPWANDGDRLVFMKQPTDTPVPTNTPAPTATRTPTRIATNTSVAATATPTPAATNTAAPTATRTPGGGKYTLNAACNPWASGGACPPSPSTALCSRRVIIIPIINGFGNGSSDPVTIQKFALFYLEGYQSGKCSGNDCEIQGRFVNAEVTTNSLAGVYDPYASITFVKLVE